MQIAQKHVTEKNLSSDSDSVCNVKLPQFSFYSLCKKNKLFLVDQCYSPNDKNWNDYLFAVDALPGSCQSLEEFIGI